MIKLELPLALDTEIRHYAKIHRIDVELAITKVLAIYLRSRND